MPSRSHDGALGNTAPRAQPLAEVKDFPWPLWPIAPGGAMIRAAGRTWGMAVEPGSRDYTVLWALTLPYAAASLLHFAHNAEYLADYPDLPASFTRAGVYAAWLAVSALGAAGIAFVRFGRTSAGLALLGIYAASGFGGLLHYTRAPIADHTAGMNLTIGLEAVAAAALFFFVVNSATRRLLGELLDT